MIAAAAAVLLLGYPVAAAFAYVAGRYRMSLDVRRRVFRPWLLRWERALNEGDFALASEHERHYAVAAAAFNRIDRDPLATWWRRVSARLPRVTLRPTPTDVGP